MTKHYKFSPSAAKRILACPGSLTLDGERAETSYATEGTEAHGVAAAKLRMRLAPNAEAVDPQDAQLASHASKEMDEAAQVFVDVCAPLALSSCAYAIETTIQSRTNPERGGTPDFWSCSGPRGVADIVDYKYGAGIPVAAERNEQLLSYAVLLLEALVVEQPQTFRLMIVQPRTGGEAVDTWECDRATVERFAEYCERRFKETHEFCAGDHCRFCPAIANCDHLHAQTVELAKLEFSDVAENATRWLEILRIAPAVKKLLESIPARMLDAMQKGAAFPGWKAVKSLGNREWKFDDDADTLRNLAKLKIGKKVACAAVLKSPTQLDREGYGDKIADLVTRRERGLSLVPESDKRPAVVFATAADTFDDLSFLD